jgi:hypothetical protein
MNSYAARLFGLFRVPEWLLRTQLSSLALLSRHFHGRPGVLVAELLRTADR